MKTPENFISEFSKTFFIVVYGHFCGLTFADTTQTATLVAMVQIEVFTLKPFFVWNVGLGPLILG